MDKTSALTTVEPLNQEERREEIAAAIRESKTSMIPSLIQAGGREGMQTMDAVLERLVKEGVITARAGLDKAADKENFARVPVIAAFLEKEGITQ